MYSLLFALELKCKKGKYIGIERPTSASVHLQLFKKESHPADDSGIKRYGRAPFDSGAGHSLKSQELFDLLGGIGWRRSSEYNKIRRERGRVRPVSADHPFDLGAEYRQYLRSFKSCGIEQNRIYKAGHALDSGAGHDRDRDSLVADESTGHVFAQGHGEVDEDLLALRTRSIRGQAMAEIHDSSIQRDRKESPKHLRTDLGIDKGGRALDSVAGHKGDRDSLSWINPKGMYFHRDIGR
ncbi:hypothetical protein B0H17DRAFT_1143920 [Mycena rosella]|uniref:Uncharacterized protein n=1 Tax=Mycena rosella TaxID=1033263 RepID=A0AAD7G3Z9_MYCRO|nr:hypothetical protein B0H17DRAFT_1143920 [Mycena rosella]